MKAFFINQNQVQAPFPVTEKAAQHFSNLISEALKEHPQDLHISVHSVVGNTGPIITVASDEDLKKNKTFSTREELAAKAKDCWNQALKKAEG